MAKGKKAKRKDEARAVRWAENYEHLRQSIRAAVDVQIFAVKALITINAGSLIAILAAIEHLKGPHGAYWFFSGLMVAAASAMVLTVYQGLVTKSLANQLSSGSADLGRGEASSKKAPCLNLMAYMVDILLFVSLGLFGWGVWSVICRAGSLYANVS